VATDPHEVDDAALLREFGQTGSAPAFAELARRHGGWVYAAALRRVRDAHLAEDVTQAVFIVLARRAAKLGQGVALSAWLFGVVRLASARALRTERRRRRHERAAAACRDLTASAESTAPRWEAVAGVLDDAMARLRAKDRLAVLERFYRRRSYAQVGAALGGISEEAARKRVGRAIERLREGLTRRGVTMSAAALAPALWDNAGGAAPARVESLAGAAHAPGAAAGRATQIAKGAMKMASYSAWKLPAALAAGAAAVVCVAVFNHAGPPARRGAAQQAAATVPSPVQAATTPATPSTAADAPAKDPQPPPKTILDRPMASVRIAEPLAADLAVTFLQDRTGATIIVDWDKLGTRGDKPVKLDLQNPTLRTAIQELLKATGAKRPARIEAAGNKVTVTAGDDGAK
jgi:RNA polymerase sigma factor (sigma-70 family)